MNCRIRQPPLHLGFPPCLQYVQFHIIGVDFLQHFQLLVDVVANGLQPALPPHTVVAAVPASAPVLRWPSSSSLPTVEALSPPSLPTVEALPPPPAPPAAKQGLSPSQRLSASEVALLTEFADVLNAEGRLPPTTHGVDHHIITEGHPVTAKFCRLDNTKLAATKEEFHRIEQEGIIRRSHSDWASPPPHMVQKTDGSRLPCGDYVPPPKSSHRSGLLSPPQHGRHHKQPGGDDSFQQARYHQIPVIDDLYVH